MQTNCSYTVKVRLQIKDKFELYKLKSNVLEFVLHCNQE